ncbi:MAG: DNA-binding protein [Candidatus Marinimicrobia bacterium]|nr:DNA-binding protein [Candidatus Neomarinimicrobiota bacterium]
MKYRKSGQNYLLRIDKGENFPAQLMEFLALTGIKTADVKGIGAVKNPVLAYYIPAEKTYIEKELTGDFEILALQGNITLKDGKPYAHFHVSLADENFRGYGGHLQQCEITGTLELFIYPAEILIERRLDQDTNLQVWNID